MDRFSWDIDPEAPGTELGYAGRDLVDDEDQGDVALFELEEPAPDPGRWTR